MKRLSTTEAARVVQILSDNQAGLRELKSLGVTRTMNSPVGDYA